MQVRRQLTQYRLMIWSGAVQYTTVGKLLVPQYLWKVCVVKILYEGNEDLYVFRFNYFFVCSTGGKGFTK